MFDVAICDDSLIDCMDLKNRINKIKEYYSMLRLHEYHSGLDLLNAMKDIRFALIFLDVQMQNMDGEETAKYIRKLDDEVILVFCTGYAEPNHRSFEVQPFRYMKKNMSDDEKDVYITDSLDRMKSVAVQPTIEARIKGKKLYLKPHDIVYIEKYKRSTRVVISKQAMKKYNIMPVQEIMVMDKLVDSYRNLRPYGFGYPHDSYIINYKYLTSCTDKEFTLSECNTTFRFTRSKAAEFMQLLQQYMNSGV